MSETHYWPTEPGEYIVSVREKYIAFFILENGLWHGKYHPELTHTTEQLKALGYLGVRREKPEPEQVGYYWPGEDDPAFYCIDHEDGLSKQAIGACWDGAYWLLADENSFTTTKDLVKRGYLGVRKPVDAKQVPSGVQSRTDETCYWPEVPGKYTVLYRTGYGNVEAQDVERTASGWIVGRDAKPATNDVMERHGFIGVQKPTVAVNVPDNTAIAKQALAELRLCRKPFETERWAYEWGPKLCQMLGAES